MAFRGRGKGRGRGRGRGGGGELPFLPPDKHKPHENFPEIAVPENTCAKVTRTKDEEGNEKEEIVLLASNEERALMMSGMMLDWFLRHSCYSLEEDAPKTKNEDKEIERFSDRKSKTQAKREALASYLKLTTKNFPAELVQGSKREQLSNKKLRWDKDSAQQAFDAFEKLEAKHKDGDKKADKESDDEDGQEEEEVERAESSDDDYNQNVEFDDDDDDFNFEEEAREDCYD